MPHRSPSGSDPAPAVANAPSPLPVGAAALARLAAAAVGADGTVLAVAAGRKLRFALDEGPVLTLELERSPLASAALRVADGDGVLIVPDLRRSAYADDPLHAALPGAAFFAAVSVGGNEEETRWSVALLGERPRPVDDALRAHLVSLRDAARAISRPSDPAVGAVRAAAARRENELATLTMALGSSPDLSTALARGFDRLLSLTGAEVGAVLTLRGERVRVERTAGMAPNESSALLSSPPPLAASDLARRLGANGAHLPPASLPVDALETLVGFPVRSPRGERNLAAALLLGVRRGGAELTPNAPVVARAFARQLEAISLRGALRRDLARTREAALESFGRVLETTDREADGHTARVVRRARRFAVALGLEAAETRSLVWGAYLHDIGKLTLPGGVLDRPRALTPGERAVVDTHARAGYAMSSAIPFVPSAAREVVLRHHERWDGGGYPGGLQRDEIPLAARAFALVDVHDALTSPKPYRAAWSADDAEAWIREQSGRAFDPWLTEVFLGAVVPAAEA